MREDHYDCAIKENLEIDGEFDGFSDAERAFMKEVFSGGNAQVFVDLMRRANMAGDINGTERERLANFLRGF